jgi:hypothetical protein
MTAIMSMYSDVKKNYFILFHVVSNRGDNYHYFISVPFRCHSLEFGEGGEEIWKYLLKGASLSLTITMISSYT